MRRFLLPLIASLSLPIAANAESAWLIMRYGSDTGSKGGSALEKLEMKDMDQCELMGAKWMSSKRHKYEHKAYTVLAYECLEGK